MKKRNVTATLGERIESVIAEKGLNVTQAAQRAGLPMISVFDFCSGKRVPTPDELSKLAKGMGLKKANLKKMLCL